MLIREKYSGESFSFKSISKDESILFTKLNRYMQNKLPKYLNDFRKNRNMQNSLLWMIESWKIRLNDGSKVGVIIMDLSKAFDNLNHELLLTKRKGIWFR